MNFNELVLEELINYKDVTFTLKHVAWQDEESGGVTQQPGKNANRLYCLKDSKGGTWWAKDILPWQRFNETPKDQHYRVIQQPSWYNREKGGYKRGMERHEFIRNNLELVVIPRLVKEYEFKQSLSPETSNTFGGIIDEL